MSTSWSAPDPRRPPSGAPGVALPYGLPATPVAPGPTVAADAAAGTLAVVVTVLLGAPVGLLWAALSPRVSVVVSDAGVALAEPASSGFIAADAAFLSAALLAGVVGGLVAWRLGRRHGPAVVLGLTAGGLLAAYVAMRVGEQVGRAQVEAAVRSGQQGLIELSVRLRAREALVAWPVGSLLAYVGASLVRGR